MGNDADRTNDHGRSAVTSRPLDVAIAAAAAAAVVVVVTIARPTGTAGDDDFFSRLPCCAIPPSFVTTGDEFRQCNALSPPPLRGPCLSYISH
jgi:hypothetical protein